MKTFGENVLLVLVIAFIASSCISIIGLYDGYKTLSEENKLKLKSFEEYLNSEPIDYPSNVYKISVSQLKGLLRQSEKEYQMVYIYAFGGGCDGEDCAKPLSIPSFLELCERFNFDPFVLNFELGDTLFTQLVRETPVFMMDWKGYSKYRFLYAARYVSDLMGQKVGVNNEADFILFKNGTFIGYLPRRKNEADFIQSLEDLIKYGQLPTTSPSL